MPPGSRSKRIALLATSIAVSLIAVEFAARWLLPGTYVLVSLTTADGREAPWAESWHYLHHYTERDREPHDGPRGRLPSNMRQWLRYDRPRWDYFDALGRIPIATNSLGFRDTEFAVVKPAGEFRVLACGDSFTYGIGVRIEDAWPQVLERALTARRGSTQVIDAGWPNTSPADYVDWFLSDGLAFSPDVVLVGLCLNDMGPVQMLGYPQAKPEPLLGGASVLLNYIQREIEQRALMRHPPDAALVVDKDPAPWERTKAALLKMRDACKEKNVRFGLVVLPMMSLLDERYPYLRLHKMADDFAEQNGIEYVDLLPRFRGMDERELWAHPTDQHPNKVGHELISAGVLEFLQSHGMVR